MSSMSSMIPHKHAEVIKAWADGHLIQTRGPEGGAEWHDCLSAPCWMENYDYRVKPPNTIRWVPVFRMPAGTWVLGEGKSEKRFAISCQNGELPGEKLARILRIELDHRGDVVTCTSEAA